ncbi:MAG: molecular chaperone HtpG [Duncaniella sp.]|uniref:molecular chaperone HtpG n=1 Tax=Duncaniella sp. TaxID=2518496 RepID=UPI0023CFCAFD|nr:molecular chaperone HtpG [Duncaniella sp.]MDE6090898.1 molecular chaperone HtpG [Duncaniella sp.]
MQKGQIGVTTENIFPVIKKFLYSDHEIFLRELVSNAIDATQKLKTLASFGEFKGELGEMNVRVTIDKEAGTLTVSDHGIGMTAEDIDKYINQIAFSGAEEFVNKYKDTANAIIGHFGLGFYSAFMVAKKVEIRSLSYKEGAEAVRWECDGSPEYTMEPTEKAERGTDIILYIDDDNKEFLEQARIDTLLKKYCRFLPVPVISGKEQEWKDGKYVDTDKDKVVNDTEPTWTKKPSELTDEDYRKFYHELYPGQEDPLFWIHLNVDYPFTLTGILFFPKIKSNLDIRKDRIQLYCNQVYVTDSVEGVVPEFMMLLQGVIDSPDIPLNVSRSYLQSDTAVKKISGYITKKVASRLDELFKENRADFESKWDDIKIFIEYGMLTDEKFCDSAMKFVLLRDTEGKYFTLEEYRTLVEASQTDKDGDVVYIYATDVTAQYNYIHAANEKGYNVLLMDGQLDGHFISLLESKLEKTRFVRVDSDVAEKLIPKEEQKDSGLNPDQISLLTPLFRSQLPKVEKADFLVSFESLDPAANPILITQNEYMRRMKDMAATQPGMSFYAELPDSYNLIVNTSQPVVVKILDEAEKALADKLQPINAAIDADNEKITVLRSEIKDNKPTDEQQTQEKSLTDGIEKNRKEKEEIIAAYAAEQPVVKQAIDLALLANGLLRGRDLSDFIARSVKML